MTKFLLRLFIKNSEDMKNENVREKYILFSGIVGIIVNIFLFIFKLAVGIFANSISIISDALNNFTDATSSVITIIGCKMSQKEVDLDHPWGHGRIEYITAFIIDIFIMLVGFELFKTSIEKIINPVIPEINNIVIIILTVAIIIKFLLFNFYRKIAKITNSEVIKSNSYDSISDCIATLSVLISALILIYFKITIDGFVGAIVSIFIMFTGFKALKEVIGILIGCSPSQEFINEIVKYAKKYEIVCGIHDIMVHDYGPGRKIISFHAEVPSNYDICAIHDVIDKMEDDMNKEFKCITTIHMDPITTDDEKVNAAKRMVEDIVKKINREYSIHDFRMTNGEEKSNLIFDVVIPRDEKIDKKELEDKIKTEICKEDKKYRPIFRIEHIYF